MTVTQIKKSLQTFKNTMGMWTATYTFEDGYQVSVSSPLDMPARSQKALAKERTIDQVIQLYAEKGIKVENR